jgi:hypothetical protein
VRKHGNKLVWWEGKIMVIVTFGMADGEQVKKARRQSFAMPA